MGFIDLVLNSKLSVIFGKKGCGKSCALASLACKSIRLKKHVYTNLDLNIKSDYLHYMENSDLGGFEPEKYGVFLLDEISLNWDNRNFRNFDDQVQKFLRLQRHFHCSIVMFSQTYDMDKKIRDLADVLYIAKRLGHFTRLMRINKSEYVTKPEEALGRSDIVEALYKVPWFIPFSHYTIFQPFYYKYFDSYVRYELPSYDEYMSFRSATKTKAIEKKRK